MTDGRLAGGSGRHERACCWRRRHDQRRTGELNPPEGGWSIHNTEVLADRAYSSWYSHGIVALDVSHPTRPAKVGQFVPPPPAGGEPPFALVWAWPSTQGPASSMQATSTRGSGSCGRPAMRVPAREAKTFSAVWRSRIDLPVRLGHSGHLPLADQPDVRAGVVLSSVPVLSVLAPPTDGGGEGRLHVGGAYEFDPPE
jgi:hypothetical protein